jgi:formylglycine-generating enzyme required for sulfatase activity
VNCNLDWRDNSLNDGYQNMAPVASYPDGISPFGAYDMVGNVWEWTADWFSSSYYEKSPEKNPQGPASGSAWVVRGGAWDSSAKSARVTRRFSQKPGFYSGSLGFRCVFDSP